jgi:hypothetical protein
LGSVPFSVELHTTGYLQPKSISDKAQTSVQPPSMQQKRPAEKRKSSGKTSSSWRRVLQGTVAN